MFRATFQLVVVDVVVVVVVVDAPLLLLTLALGTGRRGLRMSIQRVRKPDYLLVMSLLLLRTIWASRRRLRALILSTTSKERPSRLNSAFKPQTPSSSSLASVKSSFSSTCSPSDAVPSPPPDLLVVRRGDMLPRPALCRSKVSTSVSPFFANPQRTDGAFDLRDTLSDYDGDPFGPRRRGVGLSSFAALKCRQVSHLSPSEGG